jgi:hypothetical protein
MNVEIGTEAAQFPEKEYISRIFLAVQSVMLVFSTPLVKYFPSNILTGSATEGQVQGDDDCACDSKILVLLKRAKNYITFLNISLPIPFSPCSQCTTRFFHDAFFYPVFTAQPTSNKTTAPVAKLRPKGPVTAAYTHKALAKI